MSVLVGYGRSHRLVEGLLICVVAAAAARLFRDVNTLGFEGWIHGPPYPVLMFSPLVVSCVAVGALHEPFGDLDRSLTRRHWVYRLLAVGFLTLLSTGMIGVGLWPYSNDIEMALRNLAAMTGTAAWFAVVIGSRLAWLPTTTLYLAMYSASSGSSLLNGRFPAVCWEWPLLPADDRIALGIAAGLACGIPVACWIGPRELATV